MGETRQTPLEDLDRRAGRDLLARLIELRAAVISAGAARFDGWQPLIRRRFFLPSALNLAHYLALRDRDLRTLQTELMPWGLSSLGRSESRVLPNLDAVVHALGKLCDAPRDTLPPRPLKRAFERGERLLSRAARVIFGPEPRRRRVRIMVTLAPDAVEYDAVRRLVAQGMDCARINCAHQGPHDWSRMVDNVRRACAETGRACRILMDMAGPRARTAAVVPPETPVRLVRGDRLLLCRTGPQPHPEFAFQAACEPPEVLPQLKPGALVWIDEGRIGTRVERVIPEGVVLIMEHVPPKGARLAREKGLNFPGTALRLSSLTDKDLRDLDFIAAHADIVGYSFVQEPADIERLHAELDRRLPGTSSQRSPGLVIKIETELAIRNLPNLIAAAAGRRPLAVMIARGDLAVEIGYERLAEMQEELLWLCEAAHTPVVWATQVLERLVKKGTPSRAEITDAAMGVRAECVMLNKGPYISEALDILDHVLVRMQAHQTKKTSRLRALQSWKNAP